MSDIQQEAQSVVLEREMPHPPEKIWRALTQPHLIEEWLMKSDFSPVVGHQFKISFEWGAVNCRVLEVEPHRALSYTWASGELESVINWTLTPTARGTLLRMEHVGFPSGAARYYVGAKAGWPRFITALEHVLGDMEARMSRGGGGSPEAQKTFFPVIKTQRLILRPLSNDDSESLLKIFSDPEVMKYWNTPPWTKIEDALAFINSSQESMQSEESLVLGVHLKQTGELLGKCLLFNYARESRRAEIGFGLSRSCWGKGFIGEAGEALIQYGFNTLGLRRIEAEIDPENLSSAKALEKLGFKKEGHLRQRWEINGVVSDSALYGRLAEDGVQNGLTK